MVEDEDDPDNGIDYNILDLLVEDDPKYSHQILYWSNIYIKKIDWNSHHNIWRKYNLRYSITDNLV